MSSGTQVDLDWAGTDSGQGGAGVSPAKATGGASRNTYLTDEEILGIEAPASAAAEGFGGFENDNGARAGLQQNADTEALVTAEASTAADARAAENRQAEAGPTGGMPSWMRTAAADPSHGGEAQQLWREHQEFRAAFASPEEARVIKELLPGGVRDVLTLREATQSVDRIDAAIFSGDARAQSEVVAELARTNPAAFRSMFAEAAKVLAGLEAGGRRQEAGNHGNANSIVNELAAASSGALALGGAENRQQDAGATTAALSANQESQITNHQSPVTSHQSPIFDPAAYASFERSTNDAVARDVRGSISETLARVMPEGVADGAARRIGEDIFNEVHRALAADRNLSEQVAGVLRDRRFGGAEQQRVASLLAGRAKQLVPIVARRVIGEWTSTVLSTARSMAARHAAAASRVDIAAPGGSLDSMPLRSRAGGSAREVNYASMSDEEILGLK